MLAIADVCRRTQYYEQVVEGSNVSCHTSTETFFRSDPLVHQLASKITWLYCKWNPDLKERLIGHF
jgi:hypothetical protein